MSNLRHYLERCFSLPPAEEKPDIPKPKLSKEIDNNPSGCYCAAAMRPPCGWCSQSFECAGCNKIKSGESFESKTGDLVCEDCAYWCDGCGEPFADEDKLTDYKQGWYCGVCLENRKWRDG